MKPYKGLRKLHRAGKIKDMAVCPPDWQCFDNCAVCKLIKKALDEGRTLSQEELDEALAEAEARN